MKRIRRKGGSFSTTQTIFETPEKSWEQIKPYLQILKRHRKRDRGAIRLSFKMEWEPYESVIKLNEQTLEKERAKGSKSETEWFVKFEELVKEINENLLSLANPPTEKAHPTVDGNKSE